MAQIFYNYIETKGAAEMEGIVIRINKIHCSKQIYTFGLPI